MKNPTRIEKDTLGSIEVEQNCLWGAQTQRSLNKFSIGKEYIPMEIIYAIALIKQSAAISNYQLGLIDDRKKELIIQASNEITEGLHNNQFPLRVWQTGSGTHTNMNVNEVICNIASRKEKQPLGSHNPLHPNDDVNCSQSTNDVFPAAIQIATAKKIVTKLIPELDLLIEAFSQKSKDWEKIVKIGRTHLQDAVPLTLGQEVSAWKDQLTTARSRLEKSLNELYSLPLGGTAVGTGLNAPKHFDIQIVKEISIATKLPFLSAKNKIALMASHDGLVNTMSQLKMVAVTFLKIFNDIRLLSSGPRAGLAEICLPENEPGSSIMPGKVNPTQCEAMTMVCMYVIGLEVAVTMGGSGGHLQMNAYKPLIGFNLLQSIELLHDASRNCRKFMVNNMKPNIKNIERNLSQSLMLITALSPKIGYKKASEIAKYAYKNNLSLKEASAKLGYINESEFDEIIDPNAMTNLGNDSI